MQYSNVVARKHGNVVDLVAKDTSIGAQYSREDVKKLGGGNYKKGLQVIREGIISRRNEGLMDSKALADMGERPLQERL